MLKIRPCTLREANSFIVDHHRHNTGVRGMKFAVKCMDGERLCGVAVAGRPVNRILDDGETIEINRVCSDGTKNANSKLYGACCRIAKEMGYTKAITYTLESETGASLFASNFTPCSSTSGRSWNTETRPREVSQATLFGTYEKYQIQNKIRWERML